MDNQKQFDSNTYPTATRKIEQLNEDTFVLSFLEAPSTVQEIIIPPHLVLHRVAPHIIKTIDTSFTRTETTDLLFLCKQRTEQTTLPLTRTKFAFILHNVDDFLASLPRRTGKPYILHLLAVLQNISIKDCLKRLIQDKSQPKAKGLHYISCFGEDYFFAEHIKDSARTLLAFLEEAAWQRMTEAVSSLLPYLGHALESAKIQNSNSSNFEDDDKNEELEELDSASNVWKPLLPQEPQEPTQPQPQEPQAKQVPKNAICVNVSVDLENVSSQQVEAITRDLQAFLNANKIKQDSSPQPDTNASTLTFSTQKGMETVAAFLLPLSVALLDQIHKLLICPFGDNLFLRQDQGFLLVERPAKNNQEASKT